MPTYQYILKPEVTGCPYCQDGFETIQRMTDARLTQCPKCNACIQRAIVAPALGRSQSTLHDRAKSAGFHSMKRVDKGTFEKMY